MYAIFIYFLFIYIISNIKVPHISERDNIFKKVMDISVMSLVKVVEILLFIL